MQSQLLVAPFRRLRFSPRLSTFEPEGVAAFPRPDVKDLIDLCLAFLTIWQYDSTVYEADL